MPNFVTDNLPLNPPKVNLVDVPSGKSPLNYLSADDWNQLRQAVLDVRGQLIGANASPAGITSDPSSRKLVPATMIEWNSLLASCAIGSGGPRSILLMQDSTTPLVDVNGISTFAEVVPGAGHYNYRNVVPGWSRLAIGTTNGNVDIGFGQQHGNLPAPDTNSYLVMGYVRILSAPTLDQGFVSCNDSAYYLGIKAGTHYMVTGSAAGYQSTGSKALPIGEVFPFALKIDNTHQIIKAYTPFEILNQTWTALGSGTAEVDFGVALASGLFAANAQYLYGALFTGASAELEDTQIGRLWTAMGWSIDWYTAPSLDASGVYCPVTDTQWTTLQLPVPKCVWPLQETSTAQSFDSVSIVDVISDCLMSTQPGKSIVPGTTVAGRRGLHFVDGTLNAYALASGSRVPNAQTDSVAFLAYVKIDSAAVGTVGTLWSWIATLNTPQFAAPLVTSSGHIGIYIDGVITTGSVNQFGSMIPVLMVVDRTNARAAIYTAAEKIISSHYGAATGSSGIYLGAPGGIVPVPAMTIAFAAEIGGQAAEMDDNQARAFLQKFGWTVAW